MRTVSYEKTKKNNVTFSLRNAFQKGELTQEQIERLKVIGFSFHPKKPVSLVEKYPDIAKEWHPTKNGDLTPQDVSAGSKKKVWWRHWDKEHRMWHEWQSTVASRSAGTGCPYCNKGMLLVGFNDLVTTNPELAAEWHPTKNGNLTPHDVGAGSHKKVWWRHWDEDSQMWHEWQAQSSDRVRKGAGCPYCNKGAILVGFNDLATKRPNLANEWHPTKNGDLTPQDVSVGSNKKVWWRCSEGHEWQASIINRTKEEGTTCPYCSGRKAAAGFNDLATRRPDIASEWDYEKNYPLTPQDVGIGSEKEVWWRCSEGHEWKQKIGYRTRVGRDSKCPICNNSKVFKLKDLTQSLAFKNPELAKQWHPTKNGDLRPEDVLPSSKKKVWWRHWDEDSQMWHEWQAIVNDRAKRGRSCPYCSNRKALKGYNDLKTVCPAVAKEWNYEKNGNLKPEDVVAGSGKKAWWKCPECGYEWQAEVYNRAQLKTKCPKCSKGRKRAVQNIETGEYFKTIKRATQAIGAKSSSSIIAALHDKKKTAGGYHWRYVFPQNEHRDQRLTNKEALRKRNKEKISNTKAFLKRAYLNGDLSEQQIRRLNRIGLFELKRTKTKPVICIETGEHYESLKAAARSMGLRNSSSITAAIKNKTKAAGYHWVYEGDPIPDSWAKPKFRSVINIEKKKLYPSLEEAAGDVNLKSSVSIIQAIQRDKTAGGYHWRYATDDEIKEWQCSHGKK